jgi:hypothetical protein
MHQAREREGTEYIVLVGNFEEMRTLQRPWRIWDDEIKMGLKETECKGVNCIHRTLYGSVTRYLGSINAGNLLCRCITISLY